MLLGHLDYLVALTECEPPQEPQLQLQCSFILAPAGHSTYRRFSSFPLTSLFLKPFPQSELREDAKIIRTEFHDFGWLRTSVGLPTVHLRYRKEPPKAPARNSHSSFTITIYYLLCMRASRITMTFETVRTVYTHCTNKLNRAGLVRLAGPNAVQFGKVWACSYYIL